ncbi:glucose/arabinose dehydrogenase [Motilibacter peucedani]|uniref:Glucose/arabinose dehydrogenase n=1 Tax=Motilibacter peucedani TaxID=598650 RepID=A0A420XPA4_9ACTN|nr:PQQ-dependent sugar dehydrogenase [Motilibacter peucedani]RKS74017.1 glucose/arabinose dehydrogenase [Motilibacter peucedani]
MTRSALRRGLRPAAAALAVGLLSAGCGGSSSPVAAPVPPAATSGPASSESVPSPTATAPGRPGATATRAPAPGSLTPKVVGTVATGLTTPWGLAFLPDGSALVSERDTGLVKRVTAAGAVTTVGRVADAVHTASDGGEGGLLGLALDPAYPRQPYLYAYLTSASDNRVVRMTYARGRLGAPTVLLRGIHRSTHHNGGRIGFGPDGMLYVGTGDAEERPNAQDRGSLNGKILRMTRTGAVPAGNPFPGSLVWTLGHRNVQGFGWDPQGRMWADEFGQDTWDEVNRIVAGRNYGWPVVEGVGHRSGYADPVVTWHTDDASPSGLAVVGSTAYVAALKGERLWAVPLGGGAPKASFTGTYGRLRTVAVAPDGSVWLTTSNTDGRAEPSKGDDRILRLDVR